MHKFGKMMRLSVLYAAVLVLVAGYPVTTMAEGTDTTTQPAVQTTQSPATVVPAAPVSTTTTPATTTTTVATPSSAMPAVTGSEAGVTSQVQPTVAATIPSSTAQTATSTSSIAAPAPTVITPTPALTTSTAASPTTAPASTTAVDANTAATITNTLDSSAKTGNAAANNNTAVGNTTSGDASAATTILNNVNSTLSNTDNQKAANFVTNVTGDVNGDIVLQPILLKAMLENNQPAADSSTINVTNTNNLTNNINLNATSGNATALGNTQAGNATTGSANTVANVLNIVNSMVAANHSFVGTINIYGNLNGDILVAPDFIPQLLASNAGASSLTQTPSSTTVVNANDTASIVNNVSLAAASGKADLLQNTTAGNATTGDAKTNIVIFNLSGHAIVASNSLLVFVNVLGQWVGVIVNAPSGATAAAIGNGVTSNTMVAPDLVINANDATTITNNINLTSQSGNASLIRNTTAGNATSGNATASVNLANVTGSQFGLSGWFGVLFINVFGTWHGSFGLDTPYGNPLTSDTTQRLTGQPPQVIAFRPHVAAAPAFTPLLPTLTYTVIAPTSSNDTETANTQPAVLAAATTAVPDQAVVAAATPVTPSVDMRLPIAAGILGLIGLVYAGIRRFLRS